MPNPCLDPLHLCLSHLFQRSLCTTRAELHLIHNICPAERGERGGRKFGRAIYPGQQYDFFSFEGDFSS